jgi:hypothetical protein
VRIVEKSLHPALDGFDVSEPALPQDKYCPVEVAKRSDNFAISLLVPSNLLSPVVGVTHCLSGTSRARVSVPPTTVDKDNFAF